MRPQIHLISGILFVAILYFFFSPVISLLSLLIIFLSSFLIDIDHYIYYIFRKKDLNLFRAYKWYKKNTCRLCSLPKEKQRKLYIGFYIFHGIEILLILFFLGVYVSPFFSFILIGFIFHLFLDFVFGIVFEQRFDKISIAYNLLTLGKLTHIDKLTDLETI